MGIKRRIGPVSKGSPKVFSTEFFLQNHADIIGTVIVLITIGLIFEPTSKYASILVTIQHNTTDPIISAAAGLPMQYTFGIKDVFCVCFYCLVCIVLHGVIQQYLIDRSARKLHLSKIKHSKFNESGQLLAYHILSMAYGLELIRREQPSSVIDAIGGPQGDMSYGLKLFYIIQMAYWAHWFPVFHLQRIRKDEISYRATYVAIYLGSLLGAYFLNLTRIALVLFMLHIVCEAVFHVARLLYFRQTSDLHPKLFKVWNVMFLIVRLVSIILSVLVLALGLGSKTLPATTEGQPTIGYIIQSAPIRYIALFAIFGIQIQLMWRYLVFHLGRIRPKAATGTELKTKKATN